MKLMTILIVLMFSFLSHANWSEVECSQIIPEWNNQTLDIVIEAPVSPNQRFKDMWVTLTGLNGTYRQARYTITNSRFQDFNRIHYQGGRVRLVVDLWPDQVPRWGRIYRGSFHNPDLGPQAFINIDCRFPNAQ
jgi:hypothetical protein